MSGIPGIDMMTQYAKKWDADYWTFEDPTACIVGFVFRHRRTSKAAMIYFTIQEQTPVVQVHRTTGQWVKTSNRGTNITSFDFETDTPIDVANDPVFKDLDSVKPW